MTKSGLSITLIELEKICWFSLSLRNDVPLAIADAEIAPANELKNPLEILLSKIILSLSLPIFLGLSFFIVCSAAFFQVLTD